MRFSAATSEPRGIQRFQYERRPPVPLLFVSMQREVEFGALYGVKQHSAKPIGPNQVSTVIYFDKLDMHRISVDAGFGRAP